MTPRLQLAAAAAAGIAAGAVAGYALHRPAVQTVDHLVWREKDVEQTHQEQTTQAGPRVETRVVTRIVPGPAGPERIVERVRVEQGPTTTVYRAAETVTATRDVDHVVTVTPAPPPSWAFYGGLQVFPEKLPVVGVGRRLVGPIWLEAWARPQLAIAPPAVGLQVRVEF